MTRTKRRRSPVGAVARVLLTSTLITAPIAPVAAQILVFGPEALPNCAYGCVPLYNAQYECPQGTSAAAACLCRSGYVEPLLKENGGVCPDACPPGKEAEQIQKWFNDVCENFKGDSNPDKPTTDDDTKVEDKNNNNNNGNGQTDKDKKSGPKINNQATKAIEWWKRNWHWFLIAFLLITIPLVCYALWFPCRKWARKQIIKRRARRPLALAMPPPFPPTDPNTPLGIVDPRYAYGGLTSPRLGSVPPPPEGAFRRGLLGDPISQAMTREGGARGKYFPANQSLSPNEYHHSPVVGSGITEVMDGVGGNSGGMSAESHTPTPPPPVSTVRQESWERKVRSEFEGRRTVGSRLSFWRRPRSGEDVEGRSHQEKP